MKFIAADLLHGHHTQIGASAIPVYILAALPSKRAGGLRRWRYLPPAVCVFSEQYQKADGRDCNPSYEDTGLSGRRHFPDQYCTHSGRICTVSALLSKGCCCNAARQKPVLFSPEPVCCCFLHTCGSFYAGNFKNRLLYDRSKSIFSAAVVLIGPDFGLCGKQDSGTL